MPTKERMEHQNDVAEDKKGWRRRGDFKSDSEWQANVNPKPDTATTRRTYSDQRASAQAAVTVRSTPSALGGSSPGGGAWQGRAANAVTPSTPDAPPAAGAQQQPPTPAPASPIVPDWHEGDGHDDDGKPGVGNGGSTSGSEH